MAVAGIAFIALTGFSTSASATLITASVTSSTAADDDSPASHISDGSGLSGDPNGPGGGSVTHTSGAATHWATSRCRTPCDYFDTNPAPVLTFDLGADTAINGFAFWNYFADNSAAKNISLQFATAAEGTGNFGTSIIDNPAFLLAFDVMPGDPQERQDFAFGAVTARYVEVTVTDNYEGIATGFQGDGRVGMGELQFNAVPEPGTLTLFGLGLAGLGFARRRKAA